MEMLRPKAFFRCGIRTDQFEVDAKAHRKNDLVNEHEGHKKSVSP